MVKIPGNEKLVEMDQAGDQVAVAALHITVHGATDKILQFAPMQVAVDGNHDPPPEVILIICITLCITC
jgi:hypothetical protein